jgi:hypothetical protein
VKPPILSAPSNVRSILRTLLASLVSCVVVASTVTPAQAIGTGYVDPVGINSNFAQWHASGCGNSTAYPFPGKYHIGRDYDQASGTDVKAIAAGTISQISGFGTGFANAVFVKHTAPDNSQFTALYGHVTTWKSVGDAVEAGQHIADVADITGSDHLHFGIYPSWSGLPSSGWGMANCIDTDTGIGNSNGFVDPEAYLNEHPNNAPADLAVQLVHHWQSGSGATDAVKVKPDGTISGGQTTIGAVTPGNGQFGLGHFNNDSILDLYFVAHNGNSSGKTAVFVAAGPSYTTFLATVETPMGQFDSNHGDVVIGDFTGDGKFDVGVLFANNGAQKAAFGVLNAASSPAPFQSWAYLADIPIGGHDGARSDAVAGDFNHDQVVDLGVGFHQGTPSGNVDMFVLSGGSSYQSVSGSTLSLGGWQNGNGQLIYGRLGTGQDQIGAVYTANTPSGKPDLFVLNNMSTLAGSWTLNVGSAPANERTFIGM